MLKLKGNNDKFANIANCVEKNTWASKTTLHVRSQKPHKDPTQVTLVQTDWSYLRYARRDQYETIELGWVCRINMYNFNRRSMPHTKYPKHIILILRFTDRTFLIFLMTN